MKDILRVLKSFARHCLFFRGTFWPEAVLGVVGWIALITLVYSLLNILSFELSS
jgi:hypothetical protein